MIGLHGNFNVNNFFGKKETVSLECVIESGSLSSKILAETLQERG